LNILWANSNCADGTQA